MKLKAIVLSVVMCFAAAVASADLEPWQDYEMSDAVWSITTIRVKSNLGDAYLEGIRDTWLPGVRISKELGHIEDFAVYRSQLPESGDFNLLLVVKMAKTSDLEPNKTRYDAFMKEFGRERAEQTTDFAQQNYPAMRDISGEYIMREITFK